MEEIVQVLEEDLSSYEKTVVDDDSVVFDEPSKDLDFYLSLDLKEAPRKSAETSLIRRAMEDAFNEEIRKLILLREEISEAADFDYLFFEMPEDQLTEFLTKYYKNLNLSASSKEDRRKISTARLSMFLELVRDEKKKEEFQKRLKEIRDNLFYCFSPAEVKKYVNRCYYGEYREEEGEIVNDLWLALAEEACDKISQVKGADRYCMSWLRSKISKKHAELLKDFKSQSKYGTPISVSQDVFEESPGREAEEFIGTADPAFEDFEDASAFLDAVSLLIVEIKNLDSLAEDPEEYHLDEIYRLLEIQDEMERLAQSGQYIEVKKTFMTEAVPIMVDCIKNAKKPKDVVKRFKKIYSNVVF